MFVQDQDTLPNNVRIASEAALEAGGITFWDLVEYNSGVGNWSHVEEVSRLHRNEEDWCKFSKGSALRRGLPWLSFILEGS